jgi:hypothetical protein
MNQSTRLMHDVFEELATVAEECRLPNWDGYQAAPVSQDSVRNAHRVLDALPSGMPAPTVSVEPDGHVTLEWHRSPRRTLSISVGPDGDLHYAALLDRRKAYGTEPFVGEVPRVILGLIQKIAAEAVCVPG